MNNNLTSFNPNKHISLEMLKEMQADLDLKKFLAESPIGKALTSRITQRPQKTIVMSNPTHKSTGAMSRISSYSKSKTEIKSTLIWSDEGETVK